MTSDTCVSRSVLGQYLVTYGGADAAGNRAEPIAFSFIFIDPEVPEFTTAASLFLTGYQSNMRGWPEYDGTFIGAGAHGAVWKKSKVPAESDVNTWGAVQSPYLISMPTHTSYNNPAALDTTVGTTFEKGTVPVSFNDDGVSFALFNVQSSPAETARDEDMEAGTCNRLFGGWYNQTDDNEGTAEKLVSGTCDRGTDSTNGMWAFYDNIQISVSDNYRDASAMTIFWRQQEGAWKAYDSATTPSPAPEVCMTHDKQWVFDFFVTDEANVFGYKHKSNPQTHRVQFTVTDNTRPTIHPIKNSGTTELVYDMSGTTINSGTASTIAARTSETYTTMSTVTSTYFASGGSWGDYTCVGKLSKWTTCDAKTTIADCNDNKDTHGCTWTRTRNAWGAADDCSTITTKNSCNGPVCQWYTLNDFSYDSANLASTWYSDATGVAGTDKGKCRAAAVFVSSTSTTTQPSNAKESTTTYLECGHWNNALLEAYVEKGFDTRDNNDNIVGECTGYQKLECSFASTYHQNTAGTVSVGECYVNNADLHLEANTLLDFTNQITRTKANHQVSGTTNEFGTDVGFEDDYTVTYYHADAAGNVASPVTRRVVVKDTVPPTLKLDGDCVIQNSAGAHAEGYHDAADNNSTYADYNAGASNDDHGLFDHDGVARFFRHSDFCDRTVHTKVSLWAAGSSSSGVCNWVTDKGNSATNNRCHVDVTTPVKTGATRLPCVYSAAVSGRTADECFLGVFVWGGVETEAGQKPAVAGAGGTSNKLYSSSTYDSRHQKFREYQAGTYAVVYETTDRSGLKASACREIENVDHTYPIIQILGSDQMTLEATHQGNYIDDGATCSDQVDGVISQNVEVSGDVVNLSKVGTYTITYNCKDSANNAAPAATRTVVVAQTSCPKCTVHGAVTGGNENDVVHEASFPYTDPGASCSDVIDGQVDTLCFTSWDPLPDSASHWPQHTTGAVTTVTTDQAALSASDWAGKAICTTIADPNDASCADKSYDECVNAATCRLNVFTACDSVNLIRTQTVNTAANGGSSVDGASVGTYTITYRAKNTVGLYNDGANCRGGAAHYFRQVSVQDTLRPVITLKYDGGIVAQGDVSPNPTETATQTQDFNGVTHYNDEDFTDFAPGDAKGRHPSLMSEDSSSSVNGWVIGAIASAVAGLALLGYSTRRTAVATSVPV